MTARSNGTPPSGGAAVLRFKKADEWANTGDTFRVWEFVVDCPEIPATRTDASPAHAIAGDELWQDDDDEDRPLRLRRAGRTIGSPERWQIEHLFPLPTPDQPAADDEPAAGLLYPHPISFRGQTVEAWEVVAKVKHPCRMDLVPGSMMFRHEGTTYVVLPDGTIYGGRHGPHKYDMERTVYDDLLRWHFALIDPAQVEALRRVPLRDGHHQPVGGVGLAVDDIPGTPIEAGDTILITRRPDTIDPRGRLVPLTVEHFERIRDHYAACGCWIPLQRGCYRTFEVSEGGHLPIVHITPREWWHTGYAEPEHFFSDRKKWGARRKVQTPLAYVVKPIRPSAAQPVSASSDAAAIFELLSQVGGRMPAGGAR